MRLKSLRSTVCAPNTVLLGTLGLRAIMMPIAAIGALAAFLGWVCPPCSEQASVMKFHGE